MRIDDRQRLVEHDDIDIGADQPAPQRDLLLAVGGQARGAPVERRVELEHRGDFTHAAVDLGLGHAAVAQRESEIVVDGHGVVDDRELEHLRDVALLRASRRSRRRPSNRMRPSVGRNRPEMRLSSVVLPQPDGPSSA